MKCHHYVTSEIRGIRVPAFCQNDAVTRHGVVGVSHGYCEEHRCCGKCGRQILSGGCTCPDGHTERAEYITWKQGQDPTWTPAPKRPTTPTIINDLTRNTRNLFIPLLITAVLVLIVAVSVYLWHAWAFLEIYPLCVILVTVIDRMPPPRD